jgi:hypothetical protein
MANAHWPFKSWTQDHLGIRLRSEAMAFADQLLAQLHIVEDFSVEDDRHRAGIVVHRLLTGGKVDNTQARVSQPDAVFRVDGAFVRPPVTDAIDHRAQPAGIGLRLGRMYNPCNPAHVHYYPHRNY